MKVDKTKKLIEESGDDLIITPEGEIYYKGEKRNIMYDKDGYHLISIKQRKYRLHRVICTKFNPNPENKPQVNHIDGDKSNNQLSNLEWCTHKENMRHAFDTGLNSNQYKRKLTPNQVREIKSKYVPYQYSIYKLADEYDVGKEVIHRIIKGNTYKEVI